jgi:hypothetical protein
MIFFTSFHENGYRQIPLVWRLSLVLFFFLFANHAEAEGSGNWGTATNRQSWLWYPGSTGSGGYTNRGYMMLPSSVPGYNGGHRLYVYVKSGETVFWGFRRHGTLGNLRVAWFYDAGSSDFFPTGTSGAARTIIATQDYDASTAGAAQGRPGTGLDALNGPSQITNVGYQGYSFTNTTGAARAFWVEISNTSGSHITTGFNINFWDITVASGTAGGYLEHTGRVYSRFWSIANSRPSGSSTILSLTKGLADDFSFHDNFGFYVPVDNTFSASGNDYFVKYVNFAGSSGGWTNFFANRDGPRNTLSFEENRRSISGTSSNFQYPLFISDPDQTIWSTTTPPSASLLINYQEKSPPATGGEATVDLTISLPAVVDVLIDLNKNTIYDAGTDVVISEKFDAPGTYQVYWNGEDATGTPVPKGTEVDVIASVVFYPVHFPIFDLEQSLGITVTNVRPGIFENNKIFWDDTLIPRTSLIPSDSPQSLEANFTGILGPDHEWWATGDNGFSNNITINTWAGSYYTEVTESFRILPVEWLYFRGKAFENGVRLEWGTSKERNNAGFFVQRSKDAKTWYPISKTQGFGISDFPVFYQAWDPAPFQGSNYYRIQQQDLDGGVDYSSVIKVDFLGELQVDIFPNPFGDELAIQGAGLTDAVVTLWDSQGVQHFPKQKHQADNKIIYDTRDLSRGVYFVRIKFGAFLVSKKIVKSDR